MTGSGVNQYHLQVHATSSVVRHPGALLELPKKYTPKPPLNTPPLFFTLQTKLPHKFVSHVPHAGNRRINNILLTDNLNFNAVLH